MSRYRPTKFLSLRHAMHDKGYSQQTLCEEYNAKRGNNPHKASLYQCELSTFMSGKRPFRLDIMWFIMDTLELPPEKMSYYFPEDGVDLDD